MIAIENINGRMLTNIGYCSDFTSTSILSKIGWNLNGHQKRVYKAIIHLAYTQNCAYQGVSSVTFRVNSVCVLNGWHQGINPNKRVSGKAFVVNEYLEVRWKSPKKLYQTESFDSKTVGYIPATLTRLASPQMFSW